MIELAEARRAGDVGALADIDERYRRRQREGFETGEAQPGGMDGIGRGVLPATASAMARMWSGVVPQQPPTILTRPGAANSPIAPPSPRALVVMAEGVGQARIGIGADQRVGDARQFGDVGAHLLGAERAIEADRERPRMRTEFQNASGVWPDKSRPNGR